MPAPLLGAAAGILGNIFGNIGRRRAQRRANRDNIAFWNMQNEYNAPSAQMERLRAAGLNPNLIYGTSPTSAVGNAGAVAPSKSADFKVNNPLQDVNLYADTSQKEAQTNNLKTQNTVLQQDAILKTMQAAKTFGEATSSQAQGKVADALAKISVDAAKENLRKLERDTIGVDLDNQFKDQSMRDRLKNILYQADNAKATLEGNNLLNSLRKLEVDLKKLGIERNDPWYFRILGRHWTKSSERFDRQFENLKNPQN